MHTQITLTSKQRRQFGDRIFLLTKELRKHLEKSIDIKTLLFGELKEIDENDCSILGYLAGEYLRNCETVMHIDMAMKISLPHNDITASVEKLSRLKLIEINEIPRLVSKQYSFDVANTSRIFKNIMGYPMLSTDSSHLRRLMLAMKKANPSEGSAENKIAI